MIVSFASSKGGVGKSTACAAVALELARQGCSVFIYDLDPNKTLESWLNRCTTKPVGITAEHVTASDFADHFKDNRPDAKYDHVLIDLMGASDWGLGRALKVSDLVIVPSGHSQPDLAQVIKVVNLCRDLQAPFKLLFTRVRPLASEVSNWANDYVEGKALPRFEDVMIEREAYKRIFIEGKPHFARDLKAAAEVVNIVQEIKHTISRSSRRAAA